ncbi:MAG: IS110 family transposase [Planctomycetota bacterium]
MTKTTVTSTNSLFLGLDVGDRKTHFCLINEDREVVRRGHFATCQEGLAKALSKLPRCQVTLEAGSQSPWMSSELREAGFGVLVADPRKAAALVRGQRKTDRRDAESLARLLQGMPEMLGRVYHRGAQAQADLATMRARDLMVRQRTALVLHVRGQCKLEGKRLPSSWSTAAFAKRARPELPAILRSALTPLLDQLETLNLLIKTYEQTLTTIARERYPITAKLQEIHGVGPLTALAFVLTVDDPKRFTHSRDVGAWLGLVPRIEASGDYDPRLPISKAGDAYLRRLLSQCAHYILSNSQQDSDLQRFGRRLLDRGGAGARQKAVTALARKLAVVMHRLWVSEAQYDPLYNASRPS